MDCHKKKESFSIGWVVAVAAGSVMFSAAYLSALPVVQNNQRDARGATAIELVDRAIDLMGGEETLRSIQRVSLDMMTVWQRTQFSQVPRPGRPSFEPHTDVRDYSIPAWRNTRRFPSRDIINIVVDSVAVSDFGTGFRPLSIAYVDEREELFAYTPDRLVLLLKDAEDLARGADTVIGGEIHHRLIATVAERFLSTVYLHAGTGLPTLLHFDAGHPNDYGLVPWGKMSVDVWYSNWRQFEDITMPSQWDILRVGVPYKSMTVRRAQFNIEFAPDSFLVDGALRSDYMATATQPMHISQRIDSATVVHSGLVANMFGERSPLFGFPLGAVEIDAGWLVLEAGQGSYNYDFAVEKMSEAGVNRIAGVVAGSARTGNGGVLAAAEAGFPVYVSEASRAFVELMLGNAGQVGELVDVLDEISLGSGDRTVLLAPVDLPNVPGSMMVFQPASGWLFLPDAGIDLDRRMGVEQARGLGWDVQRVGTPRDFVGVQP